MNNDELTYLAYQLRIVAIENVLVSKGIVTSYDLSSLYDELANSAAHQGIISTSEIHELRYLLGLGDTH